MRYLKLALIVALPLVVATQASAIYLPGGAQVTMKFGNWDVGTVYHNLVVGTEYDATAISTTQSDDDPWKEEPTNAAVGEDVWGIFKLSGIYDATDLDKAYWLNGVATDWNDGLSEITGIFWGGDDTYVMLDANGSQNIHAKNLYFAFFEDFSRDFKTVGSTPAYELGGGPANRGDGTDPTAPSWQTATNDSADLGADGRTGTADDSTPIWTGYSIPGFNATFTDDEFFTTYNADAPGGVTGSGGFFAQMGAVPYWGTGTNNVMFDFGGDGPDMRFAFTGYDGNRGSWMVRSDDPVSANVTPELPSGALMLIGLVPMGLAFLRRKKED